MHDDDYIWTCDLTLYNVDYSVGDACVYVPMLDITDESCKDRHRIDMIDLAIEIIKEHQAQYEEWLMEVPARSMDEKLRELYEDVTNTIKPVTSTKPVTILRPGAYVGTVTGRMSWHKPNQSNPPRSISTLDLDGYHIPRKSSGTMSVSKIYLHEKIWKDILYWSKKDE